MHLTLLQKQLAVKNIFKKKEFKTNNPKQKKKFQNFTRNSIICRIPDKLYLLYAKHSGSHESFLFLNNLSNYH